MFLVAATLPAGALAAGGVAVTAVVTVQSPVAEDQITAGTETLVRWHTVPLGGFDRVVIDLFAQGEQVVTDGGFWAIVPNVWEYQWRVPHDLPGGTYRIRIAVCPNVLSDLECANTDVSMFGYGYSDFFSIIPLEEKLDDYLLGSLGPVEVQRPFRVSEAFLTQLPGWGGFYFPGMTLAKGSFQVENVSPDPYALALWAQIEPSVWPGPELSIGYIRVAHQVSPGGLTPWVQLDSPNDLQVRSGETWRVEYGVIVPRYSRPGRIQRVDIRVDYLPLCPLPAGAYEVCGRNEQGEMG